MNLSNPELLNEIERFVDHKLNKKNDLQKILSIVVKVRKEKEFEELVFTAKYLKGLMRILGKASKIQEVDSVEYVKKDLSENMKKVVNQVRAILSEAEDDMQNYFDNNYLTLNQVNLDNLNLLLSDLEEVKKYLNYVKRNQ